MFDSIGRARRGRALQILMVLVVMTGVVALADGAPGEAASYVCPVRGEKDVNLWFADTWGAPRSGGRTHKGVDMFAAQGTDILAVTGAKIIYVDRVDNYPPNDLGGISLKLEANGTQYYYAHLSGIVSGLAKGDTVSKGEVIGSLGKSGNAANTPPHLHFEIRPGGTAVNPTPSVNSWCGAAPPLATTWESGTPTWAMPAMEQAVEIGVFEMDIAGSDTIQRYELAGTLDRLGFLLGEPVAASGTWTTGTPDWAYEPMGQAVSAGLLSASTAGSSTVRRYHLAAVLDRLDFFEGYGVAGPGTWESGTPSWAHTVMGRAVSAGVMSANTRGDDIVNRYELAVIYGDRLDLLEEWRVGTPTWALPAMGRTVATGILATHVPGSDTIERYELAITLDRLGFLEGQPVAGSGTWENGTPQWAHTSMGKAVSAGLLSASTAGSSIVRRYHLAAVLDRLDFFEGYGVAGPGTWEDGTPSWAYGVMGRAVSAGVMSANTRGDDIVNRYELGVIYGDRLDLYELSPFDSL